MRCPFCNHSETKVIDSRETGSGQIIRRRRECEKCKARFSTHEELEVLNLLVKKRDGRKEQYDREKVLHGMRLACEKRISDQDLCKLICSIEQELYNINKDEVESKMIGNLVINHLKKVDEVAYLRFASVYKNFKDASGFKKEIEKLEK